MNKAQLAAVVARKLGTNKLMAADIVDAVLGTIVEATVAGDRLSVTGFGSFEKVDRPARYARNPQTGERVRVKKTALPRFRAGQGFKDLVSGVKKLPENGDPAIKKAKKRVRLANGRLVSPTSPLGMAELKRRKAKKSTPAKTTAKKAASKAPAKKSTTRKTSTKTAKKVTAKKAAAE